jgi:hypothetical protein
MTKTDVLKNLEFNLKRSQIAYNSYLEKYDYLHAKRIYSSNKQIAKLIAGHGGRFHKNFQITLLNTLEHIEVWTQQFLALEKKLEPGLETKFVFPRYEGAKEFPKNLVTIVGKEIKNSQE